MSRYYIILAFLGNSFIALAQNSPGGGTDTGPQVVFANPNDPTLSVSAVQSPVISSSNSADGGLAVLSIFSSALATFKTAGATAASSNPSPNSLPSLGSTSSTTASGGGSSNPAGSSTGLLPGTVSQSNPQSSVIPVIPVIPSGVFTPATVPLSSSSIQILPGTSTSTPAQIDTQSTSSSPTQEPTVPVPSTSGTQDTMTASMTTTSLPSSSSQSSTSSLESYSMESTLTTGTGSSTSPGVPPVATTAAPPATNLAMRNALGHLGAWSSMLGIVISIWAV